MKKQTYHAKDNIFLKAKEGKISQKEIASVLDDLNAHLQKPYGTLENYQKRYLIEAIHTNNENAINMTFLREYTAAKVNQLMAKLWDFALENRKINLNPAILQLLINHARGAEEQSLQQCQTTIVENHIIIDKNSISVLPEPKETINTPK